MSLKKIQSMLILTMLMSKIVAFCFPLENYRAIEVDEKSGTRSFRDQTGRRRFVCTQAPCAVMLKRQSDLFCRR